MNPTEKEILVHRYRYYVMDDPLISDYLYDQLERDARAVLPESSSVHGVGSSLRSSYPQEVIDEAESR